MAGMNGPRIVRDGLVLHLDAADKKSLSGSGATAWNDLSGGSNNFTLFGAPSFSSSNGGNIVFNGSTQYASSTSTLNLSTYDQITVEVWFTPSNALERIVFEHSGNWNANVGGFGLASNSFGNGSVSNECHTNSSNGARNYGFTCGTTQYSCHVNIFSKISDSTGRLTYVNNNLLPFGNLNGSNWPTTTQTSSTNAFRNDTMYLASRGGGGLFFFGSIAIFKIYNRKLSASEVLQNFNATRGRFGI